MASHYHNYGVVPLLLLLTLCGTTGTNRSVSLWVGNVTTFATKPAVGAAVRAHAPFLDKLFVAGEGSSDSYILATNGSLLPIQPAGQLLMSAFVKQQHAWGLKVVPMIGAEAVQQQQRRSFTLPLREERQRRAHRATGISASGVQAERSMQSQRA